MLDNVRCRRLSGLPRGEMGTGVTLPGRGEKGETLVGENEAAIDLYNFKHNLHGAQRSLPLG